MARNVRKLQLTEYLRKEESQTQTKFTVKRKREGQATARYKRIWPTELRRLAAVMRSGRSRERAEEAARLEAMAAALAEPNRRGPARVDYAVVWGEGAPVEYLGRAEIVERLGCSAETFSAMLSRGKGTWTTKARTKRGKALKVVICRRKLAESKLAEFAE